MQGLNLEGIHNPLKNNYAKNTLCQASIWRVCTTNWYRSDIQSGCVRPQFGGYTQHRFRGERFYVVPGLNLEGIHNLTVQAKSI